MTAKHSPFLKNRRILKEGITLRPATDDDLEFLYQIYVLGRLDCEQIQQLDWTEEQKEAFLRRHWFLKG